MASVSIEINGLDETVQSLVEKAERLADLTPVMRVIASDFETLSADSFRRSRSPDGTPWEPLSPETLARRRGTTATILVDTGRLKNSVNAQAKPHGFSLGTNVVYGAAHQFGGTKLPKRSFLPVEFTGAGYALMRTGPAGEELRRMREAITHYVATGEIL